MVTGHGRIESVVRVLLPVGFFLVLALFPFYWMAITSIKPNAELYNRTVMPLIVHTPTLKHYVDLLTKTSFLVWTWNTMLVAVVATAISLVLGAMLAYPLALLYLFEWLGYQEVALPMKREAPALYMQFSDYRVYTLLALALLVVALLALVVWPWANGQTEELKDRYGKRGDLERVAPGQFQESASGTRVFFLDKDTPDNK